MGYWKMTLKLAAIAVSNDLFGFCPADFGKRRITAKPTTPGLRA